MLIKKKKNELLIKEKLNNKFDSYHNKIPLENINSWRYSVSFQNIYNDNPDILKIFKLKNNYTINNLKEIMNIHKFTTYDWLVWSEIVIEKKGKIDDLPNHLLNYYKYLDNYKKYNTRKTINPKNMINYEKEIFCENIELINERENIICPKEIKDKNRFYELITKDFFSYDEVVELIKFDENKINNDELEITNMKKIKEKEKEKNIIGKYIKEEDEKKENRKKI